MKLFLLFFIFLVNISLLANDKKSINVQLKWLDQFEFAGYYIAKEKGFYDNYNLDVNFLKFDSNVDIVESVTSKKADFGISSSSLIIEKSKGKDILLLTAIFQSSPLVLLSLKEKNIKNISNIRNKRIMLANDQENFATIQTMLNSGGIDRKEINIIPHTFDVKDLIKNNTDLMTAYTTNELVTLDNMNIPYNILHPKEYGFDFYEDILFTTNIFKEQNPETVKNFLKATLKGWYYAFENIDETAQIIYEKYNSQNKSLKTLIDEAKKMRPLVFDENGLIGNIDENKVKLISNTYLILKMMTNNIDIKNTIYENKIPLSKEQLTYLKEKKSIKTCVDPNYFPISYFEGDKLIGIASDYINLLKTELPIDFEIVKTKNWGETLDFAKNRECDIVLAAMKTEDRLKYLNFSQPFIKSSLVLITKIDKPYFDNFKDIISTHKIGLVKNFAFTNILLSKYPNNKNLVVIDSLENAYAMIQTNEIYGLIDSIYTTSYEIHQNYLGSLKVSAKLDLSFNLSIATRNDDLILTDIINKTLNEIPEEEKISINNKWIKIDVLDNENSTKLIARSVVIILFLFIIFLLLFLNEISKKRRLEYLTNELKEKNEELDKILIIKSKQAAMGDMIDTISHQWKQPLNELGLQFLKLNTDLKFHNKTPEKDELELFIKKGDSILGFMSDTIDIFRNFFKSDRKIEYISLNEIIKDMVLFFNSTLEESNIKFVHELNEKLNLYGKKEEIFHILLCLISNSKEAIIKNEIQNPYIKITLSKKIIK